MSFAAAGVNCKTRYIYMMTKLYDYNLKGENNMFDKKGLVAGAIGTVGTVAGIGAAATGSSAAALTSGLAAAGLGSMATGIAVTAATPLAVGAAAYGAVKLVKSFFK